MSYFTTLSYTKHINNDGRHFESQLLNTRSYSVFATWTSPSHGPNNMCYLTGVARPNMADVDIRKLSSWCLQPAACVDRIDNLNNFQNGRNIWRQQQSHLYKSISCTVWYLVPVASKQNHRVKFSFAICRTTYEVSPNTDCLSHELGKPLERLLYTPLNACYPILTKEVCSCWSHDPSL